MQSSLCYRLLINSHCCSTLYCFQRVISKVACAFAQSQGRCLLPALQEALSPSPHAHHPLPSPMPQGTTGSAQHCPGLQFQWYFQKYIYSLVPANLFYLAGEGNKFLSHKALEKGMKTWCNCFLRSWNTNKDKYMVFWMDGGKGFCPWQHCQLLVAAHCFSFSL